MLMNLAVGVLLLTWKVRAFSFEFQRVTHCVMETSNGCIHWQSRLDFQKPDDAACFPQTTYVQSREKGRIPISQLEVGEEILVMDADNGKVTYQPLLAWLHRETNSQFQYNFIRYQVPDPHLSYENGIYISGMHNIALIDSNSEELHYKFAQNLQKDDLLFSFGSFSTFYTPTVKQTQSRRTLKGIYAPYTSSGNFFISSQPNSNEIILVHCFAHVSPRYHVVFDWLIKLYPAWNVQPREDFYMHPLSRYLKDFFPSVLQVKSLKEALQKHTIVKVGDDLSNSEFRSKSHGTQFQDFKEERKVLLIIDKILSSPETWK